MKKTARRNKLSLYKRKRKTILKAYFLGPTLLFAALIFLHRHTLSIFKPPKKKEIPADKQLLTDSPDREKQTKKENKTKQKKHTFGIKFAANIEGLLQPTVAGGQE